MLPVAMNMFWVVLGACIIGSPCLRRDSANHTVDKDATEDSEKSFAHLESDLDRSLTWKKGSQSTTFFIKNVQSGRCVHVHGLKPVNGAELVYWNGCCGGENVFKWKKAKGSANEGYVVNVLSGRCVHVNTTDPVQNEDGMRLRDGCGDERNKFKKVAAGKKGQFYIKHVQSGKCVHTRSENFYIGNGMQMVFRDSCDGEKNIFEETPAPRNWRGKFESCDDDEMALAPHPTRGASSKTTTTTTRGRSFSLFSLKHEESGRCIGVGDDKGGVAKFMSLEENCSHVKSIFTDVHAGEEFVYLKHAESGLCVNMVPWSFAERWERTGTPEALIAWVECSGDRNKLKKVSAGNGSFDLVNVRGQCVRPKPNSSSSNNSNSSLSKDWTLMLGNCTDETKFHEEVA
eukprot:TRINITY_DN30736_c0_g1_i1.p1 TRINITY_DN30736_c0_g1~~TRINITY_DN30736_c0_g1_i1.p1  ORF type:complete len:401 (-),score=41.90 TRINITY_DN30736_c0_g1_i1:17-1219(-)